MLKEMRTRFSYLALTYENFGSNLNHFHGDFDGGSHGDFCGFVRPILDSVFLVFL